MLECLSSGGGKTLSELEANVRQHVAGAGDISGAVRDVLTEMEEAFEVFLNQDRWMLL